MKVIIAGGRDFYDEALLKQAIKDSDFDITQVVSGGAAGADSLGEEWAHANNKLLKIFPAEWDVHGNAAGPIRNGLMAKYADALIAMWDGESRGTKDMISKAKKNRLKIYIGYYGAGLHRNALEFE